MTSNEFKTFRKRLDKTQKQMSQLLGTSIKAIHSYEQGWRIVPSHVERQVFYLIAKKNETEKKIKQCWIVNKCPPEQKKKCPAWEFRSGKLCWFINGTICDGEPKKNWQEKIETCRTCDVFKALL